MVAFVALAGLAAGATSGCGDRTYLTESYGRSYRAFQDRQTVHSSGAAKSRAINGLDSQEASIVSSSYRSGLAPKGVKAAHDESLLLLAPPGLAPQAGPNLPPPSVPGAR
jgi:hypothetical protein